MAEVGFPPGVVNIVPGLRPHRRGRTWPRIRACSKIAFTGSTAVGRRIVEASAGNLKRVQLELGGKGANIVFDDADLAAAVNGSAFAIFHNQGQACIAGSRLILHEPIADEFLERFLDAGPDRSGWATRWTRPPRWGRSPRPSTATGCWRYVEVARDEGGEVLTGGTAPDDPALARAATCEPTVVRADPESRVSREEVFGPFVTVTTFAGDDEALAIANSTRYGLGRRAVDPRPARGPPGRAARSARAWSGSTATSGSTRARRSAGVGESGYGREMGFEAMHGYTEPKSVWVNVDADLPVLVPALMLHPLPAPSPTTRCLAGWCSASARSSTWARRSTASGPGGCWPSPASGPSTAWCERLGGRWAASFTDVQQHVPVEAAARAAAAAAEAGADCLVAMGGGSATGMAKAVALEHQAPILAVPTTYAGSEVTPIYGLTGPEGKRTGRDPRVLPRTVVYDPALTTGLPAEVTGPSGMNALAHCVEALYAPGRQPDHLAAGRGGGQACSPAACPRAVADPADLAARSDALLGAWLAGSALAAAGVGIHHQLCHLLGGAYRLPHAELHAVVLPHAVHFVAPAARPQLARLAGGLGTEDVAGGIWDLGRRAGHTGQPGRARPGRGRAGPGRRPGRGQGRPDAAPGRGERAAGAAGGGLAGSAAIPEPDGRQPGPAPVRAAGRPVRARPPWPAAAPPAASATASRSSSATSPPRAAPCSASARPTPSSSRAPGGRSRTGSSWAGAPTRWRSWSGTASPTRPGPARWPAT